MTEARTFPLQAESSRNARPSPTSIPWSVAEKAYHVYRSRYGSGQSLERLAQRGGFGANEMDDLYPGWREEVSELARLKALLAEAAGVLQEAGEHMDCDDGSPGCGPRVECAHRIAALLEKLRGEKKEE